MNRNKHIWEGWTVQNFIDELELIFKFQRFENKQQVIDWCKDNQPYYKKRIKEVESYFIAKAGF